MSLLIPRRKFLAGGAALIASPFILRRAHGAVLDAYAGDLRLSKFFGNVPVAVNWAKAPIGLSQFYIGGMARPVEIVRGTVASITASASRVSEGTPAGAAYVPNSSTQKASYTPNINLATAGSIEALMLFRSTIAGDVIGGTANGNSCCLLYAGGSPFHMHCQMRGTDLGAAGATILANTIYHAIGTTDGVTDNLYLNGALYATGAWTTNAATGSVTVTLGNVSTGNTEASVVYGAWYNGVTLTTDQVQQRYLDPFSFLTPVDQGMATLPNIAAGNALQGALMMMGAGQ